MPDFDGGPTRHSGSQRAFGRKRGAKAALAAAILLLTPPLWAKHHPAPTRTIQGTVFNAAGKAVTGAEVDLTNLTTGKTAAIYSMAGGSYEFDGLPMSDSFELQAKFGGAISKPFKVSFLEPRNIVVVNLRLIPQKK